MRYYIIAGEASGDMYGATLIRVLRHRDKHAEFRFWGGDAMAAEVCDAPVRHIRDLAIMGFVEVAVHLRSVLGNISFCKADIERYSPDVVVGIDYPGFNLRIEQWAKEHGYSTVHYISPNLWAWKKGRIKQMRRSLDRLCYILPFEETFFAENDMPQAVYVGHPLLDEVNRQTATTRGGVPTIEADTSRPIVALLPGSRRQELKKSLPLMAALAARHPEYRFVVAGMSLLGDTQYKKLLPAGSNVEVVYDKTYALLATAYAAVVCSGTATLETALFGVPQVVCYRANAVSIAIAKAIVSHRINYISLVNLIADSPIVTELLQEDFNLHRLEREFEKITSDAANRERMQSEYADMRTLLGDGGASQRTADEIIALIK